MAEGQSGRYEEEAVEEGVVKLDLSYFLDSCELDWCGIIGDGLHVDFDLFVRAFCLFFSACMRGSVRWVLCTVLC